MARNTLTKQAEKAQAKSAGALNLFRSAAAELEAAVKEHKQVSQVAGAIAADHRSISDAHAEHAKEAASAAFKLRDLVGGGK